MDHTIRPFSSNPGPSINQSTPNKLRQHSKARRQSKMAPHLPRRISLNNRFDINFSDKVQVDHAVDDLQATLTEAMERHIPTAAGVRRPQPWWNKLVDSIKRKANRFFRIWQLEGHQESFINYSRMHAKFRREIRSLRVSTTVII